MARVRYPEDKNSPRLNRGGGGSLRSMAREADRQADIYISAETPIAEYTPYEIHDTEEIGRRPVNESIIVTRHEGAVEWLKQNYVVGKVISHATAEDVRGKVVYGVLPLHLAAEAEAVWIIQMDLPAELRGKDLTPDQMDACGAKLVKYEVRKVE